jgi:membrane-associated phospholipid phosphatase
MASFDPRTKSTAWVYSLAMLFAITYLGEHYAVDGVVGAAIAWGGWAGAGAFLAKRGPARVPAAGP